MPPDSVTIFSIPIVAICTFGKGFPIIGVSLIGTNHDLARRGDGEVSSRHRHVGMQEFLTQILTGGMRQVGRVDIPFPFPSHAPSSR